MIEILKSLNIQKSILKVREDIISLASEFKSHNIDVILLDRKIPILRMYTTIDDRETNPVWKSDFVFDEGIYEMKSNDYDFFEFESSGKLDLKEAEIVVSAGRGMKGSENWGMVEDLANTLGAATACSKPVSDIGWRPHSEHVGQTGKAIAPNLYIAIGISGAIQHLAGVNSSKTIVVINNDAEAPFFKSADYGVVGDAFQIIPALTEKIKALKGH